MGSIRWEPEPLLTPNSLQLSVIEIELRARVQLELTLYMTQTDLLPTAHLSFTLLGIACLLDIWKQEFVIIGSLFSI